MFFYSKLEESYKGDEMYNLLINFKKFLYYINYNDKEVDFIMNIILNDYLPNIIKKNKHCLEFIIILFESYNNESLINYLTDVITTRDPAKIKVFYENINKLQSRLLYKTVDIVDKINKQKKCYFRKKELTLIENNNILYYVKTSELISLLFVTKELFVDDILINEEEINRLKLLLI